MHAWVAEGFGDSRVEQRLDEERASRLEAGERAAIDRLDAKRRKNGETEITLVYLRGGARTACVVSFSAQEGRWLG